MADPDFSHVIQYLEKEELTQQELFLESPTLCFYWLKRESSNGKWHSLLCMERYT